MKITSDELTSFLLSNTCVGRELDDDFNEYTIELHCDAYVVVARMLDFDMAKGYSTYEVRSVRSATNTYGQRTDESAADLH